MAKILLVEDDNNLREIYEARLQAEGYDIVSARDGEEALVVAKTEKPELVISDVMMPKISGFEMLDILRNTDGLKDVKVVMLTALGQTEDQQRANKLGADRYLVKSQVTLEDIVKAAHDLLGDEEAANAAKDDKLMNDAVNSLTSDAASSAPATAPATPAAGPTGPPASNIAVVEPPATDSSAAPAVTAPAADDSDATDDSDSSQVPVAHKKVIQPIDSSPGKDIHALLAEEEAKEAKQAAGETSTAGQTVQPSPAPEPASESTPAPEPTPASTPEVAPAPEPAPADDAPSAPTAAKEEASMDAKIEDFVAGASSEPTPPLAQPQIKPSAPAAPAMPRTPVTAPPVAPAARPASTPAPTQTPTPEPAPTPPQPAADSQSPSSPSPDPNTIAL